jgi:hypothetical protein
MGDGKGRINGKKYHSLERKKVGLRTILVCHSFAAD